MTDLPKTYDPSSVEGKWYKYWEENNLFHVDPKSGREPFCIIMPPPNVTGELHMGHALQDSIQDMLVRMKRMQGFESHWQPGKDHAGIATQNVVEKTLKAEGTSRHELGREKFVERTWAWKERFGDRIFEQKRLLGDSADWSRERFTLDEGLSRAVALVFKQLYDKGLVYRGNYIVNWCTRCHTAISDDEVTHQEHEHHLWYFKYPFKDGNGWATVATTRPETMLGDTAVAVNPADERFKSQVGKMLDLPLTGRIIPVIADEHVDPAFGTGQVKVTPAHDPNDFEMGRRHNLPEIIVMDEDGVMNENAPESFRGMDRFAARGAVVEEMKKQGYLEKIEEYTTSVGHCYRCSTIIEPYLSLQWFVDMKKLAGPALKAVQDGRITFFPSRWEKVYNAWLENIRPWCISRQLWWGHRFPVWYCQACEEIIVETEPPDKCPKCASPDLKQDEDVLDTWFSSWLWPFTSLGWPEDSEDLRFWYPTDVMVTGYDIIFFWVARMIMAGLEFMHEIPFRHVYITGMVKDELGRWMSKTLGNGIDPAEMVDQYGSDAVRFTLISLASEGQDIKLTPSRFEGGRNFANKLWNSYRFLISQVDRLEKPLLIDSPFEFGVDTPLADRWIASRLHRTVAGILENVAKYRVNDVMNAVYDFIWRDYCDWYLELIKVRMGSGSEAERQLALGRAVAVFEAALRLLHPGMPFITEEMWQNLQGMFSERFNAGISRRSGGEAALSIVDQAYPDPADFRVDADAERDFEFLQKLIISIRSIRSDMRVPPDRQADVIITNCTGDRRRLIEANRADINRLATVSMLEFEADRPAHSAAAVVEDVEIYVPLKGLIDLDVERSRLEKEIARLSRVIQGAEAKLLNQKFLEKAPDSVREHEQKKLDDCRGQLAAVQRNRQALV